MDELHEIEPTEVADGPDVSVPVLERLEGRVIPYWWVSGVTGVVVLAAPVFGALLLFREQLPVDSDIVTIVAIVLFGLMFAWQMIAPPLAWQRWRFAVGDELLVARYGIIFHEEKAIPISRLQHVDLTRGPIERLFRLATLVVHTAGTEGASFRLPGLAPARATALRDQILEARGDDVV